MALLKEERFSDYLSTEAPLYLDSYKQLDLLRDKKWKTARLVDRRNGEGIVDQYYLVCIGLTIASKKIAICAPEPPFNTGDSLG